MEARESLAANAARHLNGLRGLTEQITSLHKEQLDINVSVALYTHESKKKLQAWRNHLATRTNSVTEAAKILDD